MLYYYFDFLSPYSYFSWMYLQQKFIPHHPHITIVPIPVILAKVLGHWGQLGPAQITPKRNYLFKDCLRYSQLHNIPFQTPAQLPFNSLYALRLGTLEAADGDSERQRLIIDCLWKMGWQQGANLEAPQELQDALDKEGLPGAQLLESVYQKQIRKALKDNTQTAIEKGVFGVPSMIYQDELFWGLDSFSHLESHIAGKDPLGQKKSLLDHFLNSFWQ